MNFLTLETIVRGKNKTKNREIITKQNKNKINKLIIKLNKNIEIAR